MNKFYATLISAFLLVSFPSEVFSQNRAGVVRGSYINLRSEAKFNSAIVGRKVRGDKYKILYEEKSWVKVEFEDGVTGWLFKTLVEKGEEPVAIETPAPEDKGKKVEQTTKKDPEKVKTEKNAKPKKEPVKKVEAPKPTLEKPAKPVSVAEFSGTAEELYNEAIKLYEKKKYVQALEKNQLALKKAPQNAEVLNNIGNCQFKLGRIEEALESWKEALKITPKSGKICNNLGIAYYQLDKNKDAIEYYKKAILFEPEFPDPYYNLASVQGFTGKFADAIINYRKFLEFSPDATMKKLAEERIAYCEKHVEKEAPKK